MSFSGGRSQKRNGPRDLMSGAFFVCSESRILQGFAARKTFPMKAADAPKRFGPLAVRNRDIQAGKGVRKTERDIRC
jgi:hypothetical protein